MPWNKCPETRFSGRRKLELTAAETEMEFSIGIGCTTEILLSLGLGYRLRSGYNYIFRKKRCAPHKNFKEQNVYYN